jgi:hypothetical protein
MAELSPNVIHFLTELEDWVKDGVNREMRTQDGPWDSDTVNDLVKKRMRDIAKSLAQKVSKR